MAALPPAGASDALYVVDLSGYVFRAYHALPPLSNGKGEPTHATYGMVTMLAKLVEERKPAYFAVAMDMPGRTFRADLDARYKAHRPAPPPDLHRQLVRCKEIVEAYRIPIFAQEGVEADDVIAVAVRLARAKGLRVVIASADKDLLQLVDDDRVVMWDTMRDKVYGPGEVLEKFGVPPTQLRDLLALVGDSSDNVPGVPGVGMKTAAELLAQFGTMEGVYAHLDDVKKPRIRESLKTHESDARVSQALVTLRSDLPIEADIEGLRYGGGADTARLRELFVELGFTRLLKSVPAPAAVAGAYDFILDVDRLAAFASKAREVGRLALEVHGANRDAMTTPIVGIAFACEPGRGFYVPLTHRYLGAPKQLALDDVRRVMGPVLADPAIAKIGHDVKFSEVVLARHGIPIAGVGFDTMLASYLLDPEEANDLTAVAQREGGLAMKTFEELVPKKRGTARGLEEVEVDVATPYAAPFADITLQLAERYQPKLTDAGLWDLFSKLELPLATVLAEMERVGVLVDPTTLDALGREMAKELAELEAKARAAAGQDFNIASPRQLETVLFDVLGLKSMRKTKTGRSTDADVLEALAEQHPLPGIVLEHRSIAKLKGTYVDALPRLVNPSTGRIHTRWSQAVAATGRISSQDPNLQNIPIRTALGRLIRKAFVAPPGVVLLSADYSQIELRVLAHLSQDEVLCDAFERGQDIHVRTAVEIFQVDEAGVTDEMRRQSKTINFGVIYGMGEVALARRLSIPRADAAKFIDAYFERYHGVYEFMERTMAEARKTETVRTLLGRQRHLPDLRSSVPMKRSYAERIAQNTPIQGTAADLLKLAMVKLGEPVVKGSRMVLTVHDELAFEVPEALAEEAGAKVKHAMETVFSLDVPLVVDVGWGKTWADAH